jgi:hypothetical protein
MDSELDQRLQRLFRDLDVSAQFESRLLARVRDERHTLHPDQVNRLRSNVESEYRAARESLARWRRQVLGFLTLDALAIGTTLVIGEWVLSHLLRSVALGGAGEAALNLLSRSGLVGMLLLLPVALLAPVVLAAIDYGRSPE